MLQKRKKYKIITFGCQMNKSDSERVASVLESLGFEQEENLNKADLVVINACSVRQTAIDRIWGYLNKFNKLKLKNEVSTVLTGCVLDEDKKKFSDKFDFIFTIENVYELEKFLNEKERIPKDYLRIKPRYSQRFQAFVPIMTGCNNFCSYCAVPYVRGREASRDLMEVLSEIKALAEAGCVEITLLGQNVNSYNPSDQKKCSLNNPYRHKFAQLLWEVNQIEGIKRISFTSSHPKDMDDEVIEALSMSKMDNYLHLALQSGDDEILKKMNRKYTVANYTAIIEKVRKVKPEITIGTDIIVGFPGETRKQFRNTFRFYKKIRFDIAYIAQYSPRSRTKAAELEDNVPKDEKKRRWHKLQKLMEKTALKKNKKYIGENVSVLVDKFEGGFCEGNSLEMKRVQFEAEETFVGKIVEVKIEKAREWILEGRMKLL